jgi:hypothetical protein
MNAHDIIADQVVASLPPDIDGRLRVLGALVEVLPRESERRSHVIRSLTALNTHVQMQTEFADLAAERESRGSGRLSDRPIARGSSRLSDRPVARTVGIKVDPVRASELKDGRQYFMHWAGYTKRVLIVSKHGGELYFRTERSDSPVSTVPDAQWFPMPANGGAR